MALQLRPKARIFTNPSLIHLFSTSSSSNIFDPSDPSDPNDPNDESKSSTSQSRFSSYFSDVKASLRQQQQQHQQQQPRRPTPTNPSFSKPSSIASLEEIRKNLSEFRHRASESPPTEPRSTQTSSSQNVSLQDLYKRNVTAKPEDSYAKSSLGGGGSVSFDLIRESLKQLRHSGNTETEGKNSDPMSLSAFKNTLKLNPQVGSDSSSLSTRGTGRASAFSSSLFANERKERGGSSLKSTEFWELYTYEELGGRLKNLRPEAKGDGWFSLGELKDRLTKLKEIEKKETESKSGGVTFKDLKESLVMLKSSDDEKARKVSMHKLDILGQLGRTPSFMLQPPKEHLVEKYFHLDNMSSAEKMKMELAKVREEFKMSESDCGSSRVQVAQLTVKIKHLSGALHKKDKHSRKGLIAMVERRKKLLKYLRRTDWDSYCLTLSKLGLRDNPNYKH